MKRMHPLDREAKRIVDMLSEPFSHQSVTVVDPTSKRTVLKVCDNRVVNQVVDSFSEPFSHQWVTVVNPTDKRMLLEACDNCGVVKSENTVVQSCGKPAGPRIVSDALYND